ncbi:serine hydrolase domain-containing protein [Serratia bockelmannii]|uniref:serine hydrolase domain-containing protein n=1 Tax=Serratia bockelmannii TaxID=2703793 RepID=UPI0018D8172B|nr:serine hydrolase domain-containing protein [Serratia bockelmannii]MBH2714678.1 beta-lactamase family protein [Serratia marcescens]MDH7588917.1 serine hydrolase domain-containing protein [Serratia bockelmannii]HBC7421006.1 beta-lactamase family protein [Serratia marcescens]HBC7422938.1 beta-lactamase family protein [Serratia marcescens]
MSATQRALTERIAAIDQQAMAEGRIVGSVVLVARQGEICYAGAAGYADREARRPMRRETQFRLSSVSKPYTTLAALRLIERGKLSLDDAVSDWLPWFTPALADGRRPTIKVRHLLSHTAGLDYRLNQPPAGVYHQLGIQDGVELSTLTLEQNLRLLAQAPLLSQPGERFNYSLAIDVLGAVLERVTGMPLPQLFVEWVARPLGLGNTAFYTTDAANLATPYYNTPQGPQRMHEGLRVALPEEMAGGEVLFSPARALNAEAYPSGGAGMVGDADDVLQLVEALRSGGQGILQPDTVALLRSPHVGAQAQTQGPGWGFGFGGALLVDAEAAQTPQHVGTLTWGGVYGHSWFFDPQAQLSVVILTNTAFEGMCGRYPQQIRDAVYAALQG